MAFTSFTALRTSVRDALADGSILTKSYSINGRNHTFRDMKEVIEFLEWLDNQIQDETKQTGKIALGSFG